MSGNQASFHSSSFGTYTVLLMVGSQEELVLNEWINEQIND